MQKRRGERDTVWAWTVGSCDYQRILRWERRGGGGEGGEAEDLGHLILHDNPSSPLSLSPIPLLSILYCLSSCLLVLHWKVLSSEMDPAEIRLIW